jgi:nitroimidazol reductase NimA-like FMN-containing flavoprotein (pyridoxamine 5'-phosphate oxidase superfamily)
MGVVGPAAQTVSDIIEASRYLVLATADAAGRPWSSPVYFAHVGLSEFFWVSVAAGRKTWASASRLPEVRGRSSRYTS